jgi:hypothetical protein
MIIFLRKIPADTKLGELVDFVTPALKGNLFRKSGKIVKVDILSLHDIRLNTMEFHGLVTVEPEVAGFRALKLLKGRRFKDRLVVVRQYFQRSWQNDNRQNYRQTETEIVEKRKTDRRRGKNLEIIKDISEQFSSTGDFVRKSL